MNEIKKSEIQRRPRKRLPHKLLVVLILVVSMIIVGGSLYYLHQREVAKLAQGVCHDKVAIAAALIREPKNRDLLNLTEEIEKMPGYENDVNCMYIVTQGYLSISDAEKSRASYERLVKLYKPDVGYSSDFGSQVTRPEQLEQLVAYIEAESSTPPTGTFFVEGPTQ